MRKDLDLLILLILLASCIVSAGFRLIDEFVLDYRFYVGSTLVIAALIFKSGSKKVSEYLLWAILILGTINVITVSHAELSFEFSMGPLTTPGINPLMLITLIFWYLATQKREESIGKEKQNKEEMQAQYEEDQIKMFMKEHANKSNEELEKIANGEGKYLKSAVVACERILNQRNENAL